MHLGDVIRLMCALLATTMGAAGFENCPAEFKKAAIAGAEFLDRLEGQVKELGGDAEIATVWTPEDCQTLFNLIAALQATQAANCPIA